MLRYWTREPDFARWRATLPILGVDGSLAGNAVHTATFHPTPTLPAADRRLWCLEGETVRSAADQLRLVAPADLPVSFPAHIVGPAGSADGAITAGLDTDPLPLLERAWRDLELIPDEPANVDLLLATFAVADALAAARSHYE
jgi:hypothetical protein